MKQLLIALFTGLSAGLFAQNHDTSAVKSVLPFSIHDSKRIPDFELEDKKEGTFLTGLPRFEFDPIRGVGFGGNINLFINKSAEDPFFSYTAYRHRFNAEFFIFQNGRIGYSISYDAPYIFNSKWRLRIDALHWEDPHAQYWGIGRASLGGLHFRDKKTGMERSFNRMDDYDENLALAEIGSDGRYYSDFHYNHMHQREQFYNVLGERVLMDGKLRVVFGYEALLTSFSSYNGQFAEEAYKLDGEGVEAINNPTLVDLQQADGTWDRFNLSGFNERSMFTSMLAGALIFDTRDFEPDPSQGMLFQYSHEYSAPWLGSQFNFNKVMVQGQFIHTLKRWRGNKSRLTLAGSAAVRHISGSKINFIEMWDLPSEGGGVMVLGGARSVRGYREARFVAPTVALVNLELRTKFYDFSFLQQHFALGITPFYDLGSVWDQLADINFQKWIGAPGLGGRINWNQSTVIRLDYAQSMEGGQFFFGFGHVF